MTETSFKDFNNEKYFQDSGCHEDSSTYFDLARVISEGLSGRVLDLGCGLGWLVKHLRGRGIDAWGLDNSSYAIEHSANPEHCLRGSIFEVNKAFSVKFDVVVLQNVCQVFELPELVEIFKSLHSYCKGKVFILDQVPDGHGHFAIKRGPRWYQFLGLEYGWQFSEIQPFLRKTSPFKELLVLEQYRVPFKPEEPSEFIDPWLVKKDNTNVMSCTLPTSELESAAFTDHLSDLWMSPHFVPEGGTRVEREQLGVTRGSGDYCFVSDDTARISKEWLLAVLSRFRDPDVGAVISPVHWLEGKIESPEGDYWNRFPMMFRVLAYQQSQGDKSKFDELGWKVAKIKTPCSSGKSEPREFDTVPSVTIITAFDDSKVKVLPKYFEALTNLDYPRNRLHIHFWNDTRKSVAQELVRDYVRSSANYFASTAIHQAISEEYWLYMKDDEYYRWEGVKYPISARMSGVYNRATSGITTDQVLLWESDTIPTDPNFLKALSNNLGPFDGGISGHYVCRIEEKSLAWKIENLVPLDWEWIEPGTGIQVVDAVPHGLLLLNSWCLKKFRFNVLANDPRDYRGPDIVMGRDFKRLHLKLMINWDVHALHYDKDGETFIG